MSKTPLVSVIETEDFLRQAERLLSDQERDDLKVFLAANPTAGVEIGSSIRKLRWAIGGRGKSGGVRVIHFFINADSPVILLDVFGKSEKANYSAAELREIREVGRLLAAIARGEQ